MPAQTTLKKEFVTEWLRALQNEARDIYVIVVDNVDWDQTENDRTNFFSIDFYPIMITSNNRISPIPFPQICWFSKLESILFYIFILHS